MMKIERAQHLDPTKLLKYFKSAFPDTHASQLDAYFKVYYKPEETFVLRNKEHEILGLASVRPKILHLNNQNLKVSYINRIMIRPEYQGKGNMNLLMNGILDHFSKTDLITLLRAYEPKVFEKFGFESVIQTAQYTMSTSDLPRFSIEGIVVQPKSEGLVKVYERFTEYFDGYFLRNVEDFNLLQQTMSQQNGGVVGLSHEGQLVGYCVYKNHGSHVEVFECAYDKSGTLLRLLSFVSKGKHRLIFHASVNENIQRVLPHATKSQQPFLLARINDRELFERLYDVRIISAYSGFKAFGKPLFNRDFQ